METINPSENPQRSYPRPGHHSGPVSVGDWFVTIFLASIPVAGLILLLIWAFGGATPPSKANWAKAMLLWILVGIVLTTIFWSALLTLVDKMGGW